MATNPNFTCNLNTLITNSKCFSDKCLGEGDRDAIDIYSKIINLAADGGTNYTANLPQLMIDASLWMKQSRHTLETVETLLYFDNAIGNGGSVIYPSFFVTPLTVAKCVTNACIGKQQARGLKTFLKCAINKLGFPD